MTPDVWAIIGTGVLRTASQGRRKRLDVVFRPLPQTTRRWPNE